MPRWWAKCSAVQAASTTAQARSATRPFELNSAHNVPAGQLLHHEEAEALVLDEVVDRHDVRMVERRKQARLRDEASTHGGVTGERARQLLDRDLAAELTVSAREHDTPATAAELAAHFVGRESRGDPVAIERHACSEGGAGSEGRRVAGAPGITVCGAGPTSAPTGTDGGATDERDAPVANARPDDASRSSSHHHRCRGSG